ncbi:hypothetical protein CHUAL_009905 [Chamberlinius hualienensis]
MADADDRVKVVILEEGTAKENVAIPRNRLFPSARMTVALLMLKMIIIAYILRLNMGIAIVCMIKTNHTEQHGNETVLVEKGEFEWEKSVQGSILSAFFYGYILTQIPSGWLADKIGGKVVLATGLGVFSVLTLIIPVATRWSSYALLAIRVLHGMFSAATFPAIHSIMSNWAPPGELGLLMAITYSGMHVGSLLTFPLCGFLCEYGFGDGWSSIFYVTGLMGILSVVIMWFLVYDKFDEHPRIKRKERSYLEKTIVGHAKSESHEKIPWCAIARSTPVWAISVAHMTSNFGLYFLCVNLPLFMKEVLKFDIKENGTLSSLPYLATLIVTLICGQLSDFLRRKAWFSITIQRKLFNSIGTIIPGIGMLLVTFMDVSQRYFVVGIIITLQAAAAFSYSGGFFYNHVDLSPKHAGILMGITNTFGTMSGIIAPTIVGQLTPNGTQEEWNIIFYLGASLYLVGAIVYTIFASGERQKWSFTDKEIQDQLELKTKFINIHLDNQEK